MLSNFSVKRPYLVIVAVIIALILGGVSLSRMHTNLLPQMDLPYLAVITVDPGASAEKVEEEVTGVLEGPLSTINGVERTMSRSSDNVSMIFLQFQDGTDMDSAMVKASSAVNQVSGQLPETASTPNYMEVSMDMTASMYLAVSYEGKDIYETSELVEDEIIPSFRRLNNTSDVQVSGQVVKTVEIHLDRAKADAVNARIKSHVESELADAEAQIAKARSAIKDAESQLDEQEKKLADAQETQTSELGNAQAMLTSGLAGLQGSVATLTVNRMALQAQLDTATIPAVREALQAQIDAIDAQLADVQKQAKELQDQLGTVNSGVINAAIGLSVGTSQISQARTSLEQSKAQLDQSEEQMKSGREDALKNANIDKLLDKNTLSQLIKAQNFSMPAGSVEDVDDELWMVRVGETFDTADDLRSLLLADIDGVGEIRLGDVAEVVETDNVDDAYTKIDGDPGVVLSLYKNSTSAASDLSAETKDLITKLEAEYPGLHIEIVSDQGQFITRYISNILQSLIIGAILALIVLALFLKSAKPTVIVAFSIPFSVLLALLFMYFTGIDLNIMSLGGISIAIGMLVDNSIIVLENIYRLRARGVAPARAAAQGAKQITGAVIASTITTICVFVPIMFTTGMVNQLMVPFALTVAYVLAASLLVALTLVPAVSSFVLRNHTPREIKWFEGLRNKYAQSLNFCLNHKVIPLAVASVLLVGSIIGVVRMGVVLIPSMTGATAQAVVTMPEDTEKEDAFKMADEVMDIARDIEGVRTVGAIDAAAMASVYGMGSATSSGNAAYNQTFQFFMRFDEGVNSEQQVKDIIAEFDERTADLDCEVTTSASDSGGTSSLVGSGLSITIKGDDPDTLEDISYDLKDMIEEIEGYTEVENGMEDATNELKVIIDRDKLTAAGYSVAQLYTDLAGGISTESTVTTMTLDKEDMEVKIIDERNPITKENILDRTIEITNQQGETKAYELRDFARVEEDLAAPSVGHENGVRMMTVTADVEEGYNNALLARDLQEKIDAYDLPAGYTIEFGGELDNIRTMLEQMMLLLILGFVLIYLVMVAQFQSLLSPLIIILTVPLAFTGGFLGLLAGHEQLSMLSLMGFAVLMGTVVNNGIVFVDFVNQMRRGGMPKREALLASGRARIRPILMTALTTILAMVPLIVSWTIGASLQRGMALVVAGGLLYATFMTLYIVPIMYDLLYRKVPKQVDVGEDIDDDIDDAQALLDELREVGLTEETTVSPELVGGEHAIGGAHAGS